MDVLERTTNGGEVTELSQGTWRLSIPQGPASVYRWAQLDDYMHLSRKNFLWQTPPERDPLVLEVDARVSDPEIPGTWGFGFWNDPFNAGMSIAGTARRLPMLPNAAWYFYASPPNHLALHDHPGDGMLAATFSSPRIPPLLLGLGLPAVPLLAIRPTARLLMGVARKVIRDDAVRLDVDLTVWHHYELRCEQERVIFRMDEQEIFSTTAAPRGRLGLVAWIDNQYAAVRPNGTFGYGVLANPKPVWMEMKALSVLQAKQS